MNPLKRLSVIFERARVAIVRMIDLRDVFVFGGLGAIGYGIAQLHTPSAWIVIGIAVLMLGLRR